MTAVDALKSYGLNDQYAAQHAAEMEELRIPVAQAGLNWLKVIALLSKYGPSVVAILQELLKSSAIDPPPVSPNPAPIPQR